MVKDVPPQQSVGALQTLQPPYEYPTIWKDGVKRPTLIYEQSISPGVIADYNVPGDVTTDTCSLTDNVLFLSWHVNATVRGVPGAWSYFLPHTQEFVFRIVDATNTTTRWSKKLYIANVNEAYVLAGTEAIILFPGDHMTISYDLHIHQVQIDAYISIVCLKYR